MTCVAEQKLQKRYPYCMGRVNFVFSACCFCVGKEGVLREWRSHARVVGMQYIALIFQAKPISTQQFTRPGREMGKIAPQRFPQAAPQPENLSLKFGSHVVEQVLYGAAEVLTHAAKSLSAGYFARLRQRGCEN